MLRAAALLALATPASSHESVTVMSFNIRTASRWAATDGGDRRAGRTWDRRSHSVARAIEIGAAAVVGTQEGLGWQVDELVALLGPSWRRVGGGRVGDGSDDDETASILYDSASVALVATGDYWLSETPAVSSTSWGAALPRVATWATFAGGGGERFAVVNCHFDHASSDARTRSAGLVAADSARRFDADDVVFLTGDFNAVAPASPFTRPRNARRRGAGQERRVVRRARRLLRRRVAARRGPVVRRVPAGDVRAPASPPSSSAPERRAFARAGSTTGRAPSATRSSGSASRPTRRASRSP